MVLEARTKSKGRSGRDPSCLLYLLVAPGLSRLQSSASVFTLPFFSPSLCLFFSVSYKDNLT